MPATLYCFIGRHTRVHIDPTGGDPDMGGPVYIPVCADCGVELTHGSDTDRMNADSEQRWQEAYEAKHGREPRNLVFHGNPERDHSINTIKALLVMSVMCAFMLFLVIALYVR